MESKKKRILILLYSIICWMISICGLMYQVGNLSADFFKYTTISQLLISRPQFLSTLPALDMCVQMDRYWVEELNRTVADFLKLSSPVEEVMSSVDYRKPPYFEYTSHVQSPIDPMRVIKIEKFIKNKFGCYSFKLQPEFSTDFDYQRMVKDSAAPSRLWTIFVNPKSTAGTNRAFWYIFMHPARARAFYQQGNNFIEVFWAPPVVTTDDHGHPNALNPVNRIIALTYKQYQSVLLPPPYNTNCFNYSLIVSKFDSQAHCYETCYNETIFNTFNLVSTTIPTFEYTHHKRFLIWKPEYWWYVKGCLDKCPLTDCIKDDFIPVILSLGKAFIPEFRLYETNTPVIRQSAVAKLDLTEYITFLLSSVSFWLSISPLDLLLHVTTFGRRENDARKIGDKKIGGKKIDTKNRIPERRPLRYLNNGHRIDPRIITSRIHRRNFFL